MLTAGDGQTVSTHRHQHLIQQASQEAWYSVLGCSRGYYYGYGHAYVTKRSISADAYTQHC